MAHRSEDDETRETLRGCWFVIACLYTVIITLVVFAWENPDTMKDPHTDIIAPPYAGSQPLEP